MSASLHRVLVVDDNDAVRASIRTAFVEAGFTVFDADSRRAASSLISRASVQALVTDVRMGLDDDGLRLLGEVMTQDPRMPACCYTYWPDPDDEARAIELGATDYFWMLELDQLASDRGTDCPKPGQEGDGCGYTYAEC